MTNDELSGRLQALLKPLLAYCRRLTRSSETAEDLVQEAYLKVLSGKQSSLEVEALRPTMFKAVRNLVIDSWRAQRRRPCLVSLDECEEGVLPLDAPQGTPVDKLLADVFPHEIEQALDDLEQQFFETLWLREFEGFSYQQIAEITGVPVGTVRSRLARARKNLAQALETYVLQRGLITREAGL